MGAATLVHAASGKVIGIREYAVSRALTRLADETSIGDSENTVFRLRLSVAHDAKTESDSVTGEPFRKRGALSSTGARALHGPRRLGALRGDRRCVNLTVVNSALLSGRATHE
jgi:hypothetical protein